MDLVKYFAGSRVLGTAGPYSDLDFVQVYRHRLVDVLRGVCLDDWDAYPKDNADMYEIQKFVNELHMGNSFLYGVLLEDKKEWTTDEWNRIQDEVLKLAKMGAQGVPYNRVTWVMKNLEWFEKHYNTNMSRWWTVEEAIKRALWIYYWTRQALLMHHTGEFVRSNDIIFSDTKYGEKIFEWKQNPPEEGLYIPWDAIIAELNFMHKHAYYTAEWDYENMNQEANELRCDILQKIRTAGVMITVDNNLDMIPGPRTSYEAWKQEYREQYGKEPFPDESTKSD